MYNQPYGSPHSGSPHNDSRPGRGWSFGAFWRDLKIAWRLIWDPAVPALLKICLPFLAFLYFLWPIDLLPGLLFDDIAIFLMAVRYFVRLSPQDRVHKAYPEGARHSTYYDYRNGDYRNGHFHNGNHHAGGSRGKQASNAHFRNGNRQNGHAPDDDHDVIDTTWRVIDDK